ncbi:hypothetical protein V2A60_000399 [Cordyceps javanica]
MLLITFPKRLEDTASFDNYPSENDVVHYEERIYTGHHFFEHRKIEPLLPFGAGLSYTTFEYSNMRPSSTKFRSLDSQIRVSVDITNTGSVNDKEIVQVFVPGELPSRPSTEGAQGLGQGTRQGVRDRHGEGHTRQGELLVLGQ